MEVRAKKSLGQHFLKDPDIARRIVDSLTVIQNYPKGEKVPVLEVGPGTGVLTRLLIEYPHIDYRAVELDSESVAYLNRHFPSLGTRLFHQDFLKMDCRRLDGPFYLIGNFPYNISSQIFFKVLEYRDMIPEVVGMVQKEVAERLCASPGSKTYGILSVLLQAWYRTEYLFTVPPGAFLPPPKVHSGVIRLIRNGRKELDCPWDLFVKVVKTTFNQRRKTIRNSLKPLLNGKKVPDYIILDLRPEQLNVEEFTELTQEVAKVLNADS